MHGHYIPAGTTVGINAWAINRNQELFGEDAETFRPERWLEASEVQLTTMKKAMFTVCPNRSCSLLPILTWGLVQRWSAKLYRQEHCSPTAV
jgi:cytochrome P450